MAKEIWDAYNARGNRLGFDLVRGEPIPQGVFHLAVEIVTIARTGEVLLTRRHPQKPYGLLWEITGGSALKGEAPLQAAVRELREETGISMEETALRPLHTMVVPHSQGIYHTFAAVVPAPCAVILQEGETVDSRWMPYEEFRVFTKTEEYAGPLQERGDALLASLDALWAALKEEQHGNDSPTA